MPRPQRCRRVCREPDCRSFSPDLQETGEVLLSIDEFEAIRLVDFMGQTHEQCAAAMDVSRTTATEIYAAARFKIADALVNGRRLVISGGKYRLCEGMRPACHRRFCQQKTPTASLDKGGRMMKIAVTYENGNIYQHFGHTEQFKLYTVQDGKIVDAEIIGTDGQGHGALAEKLSQHAVDLLICGGIGGGAQMALAAAGIGLYAGVQGSADAAVEALLAGTLAFDPNANCDHHGHGHGGADAPCGSGHGCGRH